MSSRDHEYDRFGPWVVRVSDEDPPPPRFLPYLTRNEPPLISIKIPRKVARRDAHPGMDLYDYVVSLYERDMVVLERVGTDVRSSTIAYHDIGHLRVGEDLLRGTLQLGVQDEPADLPFNTVSNDVMREVVGHISERLLAGASRTGAEPPAAGASSGLSFYFERLLKEQHEQAPTMVPVAMQAETSLRSLERGRARRLLFGIVDKRLLESLHFSDGRELRVVDRGQTFAYRWQTVYARRETLIPLAKISDVTWADGGDPNTTTLTIRTSGGAVEWVFVRANDHIEPYREWLTQLMR